MKGVTRPVDRERGEDHGVSQFFLSNEGRRQTRKLDRERGEDHETTRNILCHEGHHQTCRKRTW